MRCADTPPGTAPVRGHVQSPSHHVEAILVGWIDAEVAVVERARGDRAVVADVSPGAAAVAAAPQGPVSRLDHCVHHIVIGDGNGHADAAEHAGRQPVVELLVGELGPAVAAIATHVQAAARAARAEVPRLTQKVPHTGVKDAGVGGVHRQVGYAGGFVDVENLFPGLAAIEAAVHAAVRMGSPGVPHRPDINVVGVVRMHADAGDALGSLQADVGPRVATVGRAIHAVAKRRRVARVVLAGAEVDHIRVRRGYSNCPERQGPTVVEDRLPGDSAILGTEQAAGSGRHVEHVGAPRNPGQIDRAATHESGTDRAPGEAAQQVFEGGVVVLLWSDRVTNRWNQSLAGEQHQQQGNREHTHRSLLGSAEDRQGTVRRPSETGSLDARSAGR